MSDNTFNSVEEASNEDSSDFRVRPEDFSNIFVIPSDWTVSTLRREMDDIIDLNPEFQRRSVWLPRAKSRFIESLILGIPIPQILLAENPDAARSYVVLDGKQRLLTIKEFFEGYHAEGPKFKLTGLDDLKHLNNKTWDEIQYQFPAEARAIDGAQIRTAVIRGWSNENVLYEMFYRLNSGSVRLSPMELRMSLIRGPFIPDIVRRSEELDALQETLRNHRVDRRMRDVEVSIRHMAFEDDRVPYTGNLKSFLDSFCKIKNKEFDPEEIGAELSALNVGLRAGLAAFKDGTFCRRWNPRAQRFERLFNRAIFDVMAGSLRDQKVQDVAESKGQELVELFKFTCSDAEFIRAVEVTTKTSEATKYRFKKWYDEVNHLLGTSLRVPEIVDDDRNDM